MHFNVICLVFVFFYLYLYFVWRHVVHQLSFAFIYFTSFYHLAINVATFVPLYYSALVFRAPASWSLLYVLFFVLTDILVPFSYSYDSIGLLARLIKYFRWGLSFLFSGFFQRADLVIPFTQSWSPWRGRFFCGIRIVIILLSSISIVLVNSFAWRRL